MPDATGPSKQRGTDQQPEQQKPIGPLEAEIQPTAAALTIFAELMAAPQETVVPTDRFGGQSSNGESAAETNRQLRYMQKDRDNGIYQQGTPAAGGLELHDGDGSVQFSTISREALLLGMAITKARHAAYDQEES